MQVLKRFWFIGPTEIRPIFGSYSAEFLPIFFFDRQKTGRILAENRQKKNRPKIGRKSAENRPNFYRSYEPQSLKITVNINLKNNGQKNLNLRNEKFFLKLF